MCQRGTAAACCCMPYRLFRSSVPLLRRIHYPYICGYNSCIICFGIPTTISSNHYRPSHICHPSEINRQIIQSNEKLMNNWINHCLNSKEYGRNRTLNRTQQRSAAKWIDIQQIRSADTYAWLRKLWVKNGCTCNRQSENIDQGVFHIRRSSVENLCWLCDKNQFPNHWMRRVLVRLNQDTQWVATKKNAMPHTFCTYFTLSSWRYRWLYRCFPPQML